MRNSIKSLTVSFQSLQTHSRLHIFSFMILQTLKKHFYMNVCIITFKRKQRLFCAWSSWALQLSYCLMKEHHILISRFSSFIMIHSSVSSLHAQSLLIYWNAWSWSYEIRFLCSTSTTSWSSMHLYVTFCSSMMCLMKYLQFLMRTLHKSLSWFHKKIDQCRSMSAFAASESEII